MQEMLEKLTELNAKQANQIKELVDQNRLLSQKIQFLLKRLFGRKSEKLDKSQLELLLGELEDLKPDGDDTQGLMSEVIEHGYANLPGSDLEAIATYLKSIPAIENDVRRE